MRFTPIPDDHATVLFHVSEIDEELLQVGCSLNMDEYLAWVFVELGFPVFTPPWMAEPDLPFKARLVRQYQLADIRELLVKVLSQAGWNGQELLVCVQGRAYCSVSFFKERAG
jgi:hypothetical protein